MVFNYFRDITFGQPLLLLLLAIIPLLIIWKFSKGKKQVAAISVSSIKGLSNSKSWKNAIQQFPFILRILALGCIIVALARPQTKFDETQTEGEGIDIILCIDVSGSMTAQDFTPNRMEAAKKVAIDFINHRTSDRIGVVIFGGGKLYPMSSYH